MRETISSHSLAENAPPVAPRVIPDPLVGKTPFMVRCGQCGHTWPALWMPMSIDNVASVLKSVLCPACAADAVRIDNSLSLSHSEALCPENQ